MSIGFVLDFDGTVTTKDITLVMMRTFGKQKWLKLDWESKGGRSTGWGWLTRMVPMLPNDRDGLMEFVKTACIVRPHFKEFVDWAKQRGYGVAIATDGFGFYLDYVLEKAGVTGIPLFRNNVIFEDPPRPVVGYPYKRQGGCEGCATCKRQVVEEWRQNYDRVVFVGDGTKDKFGASHADAVFARDRLISACEDSGIKYRSWEDFQDIIRAMDGDFEFPGPSGAELCPVSDPQWLAVTPSTEIESRGQKGTRGHNLAACGIDCSSCDIYKSKNDPELASSVAAWFKKNRGVTLERVGCEGCGSTEGGGSPTCWIPACVAKNGVESCKGCAGFPCPKIQSWSRSCPGT